MTEDDLVPLTILDYLKTAEGQIEELEQLFYDDQELLSDSYEYAAERLTELREFIEFAKKAFKQDCLSMARMSEEFKIHDATEEADEAMWWTVCIAQKIVDHGVDSVPKGLLYLAFTFAEKPFKSFSVETPSPYPNRSFWRRISDVFYCETNDDLKELLIYWRESSTLISRETFDQLQKNLRGG